MTLEEQRKAALAATANPPPGGDFVWEGEDEDDRPLTTAEWKQIRHTARHGHPKTATTRERIPVPLDADIVAKFRASGEGWQTRVNDALREYVAGQN